jgi:hypothetical protein
MAGSTEQRAGKHWRHHRRRLKSGAILAIGLLAGCLLTFLLGAVTARSIFHLTSDNAVLYFLQQTDGSLEVTNHLRPGENSRVVHMLDISCVYNLLARTEAGIGMGSIETTWNDREGDGVIKEYRNDGTEFLVVLARYVNDNGTPQGLFIGGDLPLGDVQRIKDTSNNNTGMAYYDGKRWNHIWCSLNEGTTIAGGNSKVYAPEDWKYLGSKVLKSTSSEVVIESSHKINTMVRGVPVSLLMKRTVQKKLGEDYILLKVEFMNPGSSPLAYSYELGDEPWVGEFFRGSRGNIGWTDGELYKYEGYVNPSQNTYAGYWDIGNDVINEAGEFTRYADFVEWLSIQPDYVYFSNKFGFLKVNEKKPLSSRTDRVVSLVWNRQILKPGEQRAHVFALGMAKPDSPGGVSLPVKPTVRREIN